MSLNKMLGLIVAAIFIIGSLLIIIYAPFPLFRVAETQTNLPKEVLPNQKRLDEIVSQNQKSVAQTIMEQKQKADNSLVIRSRIRDLAKIITCENYLFVKESCADAKKNFVDKIALDGDITASLFALHGAGMEIVFSNCELDDVSEPPSSYCQTIWAPISTNLNTGAVKKIISIDKFTDISDIRKFFGLPVTVKRESYDSNMSFTDW